MIPPDPEPLPPQSFRGLAITAGVALAAALVVVLLLVRSQSGGSSEPPTPALLSETQVHALPSADAEIVGLVAAETAVTIFGRSQDSAWLMVSPTTQPSPRGWVPVLSIRNAGDLAALAPMDSGAPARVASTATTIAVAASTTVTATALTNSSPSPSPTASQSPPPAASASPTGTAVTVTPTGTPTIGIDLRVDKIGSEGNRLFMVLKNFGTVVSPAMVQVRVNDGAPLSLQVMPLATGDTTRVIFDSEYVQRRATVTIALLPPAGSPAGTQTKSATAVIEPDKPNDIELLPPEIAEDGHLRIVLRNNSPIPIVGAVTVSVRAAAPPSGLLARRDVPIDLEVGAMVTVDFTNIVPVGRDTSTVHVSLNTDAITDADPANDNYPLQ